MGEHLKSEMFISWFKSIERMICDARHNIIKRPSKNNTNKNWNWNYYTLRVLYEG